MKLIVCGSRSFTDYTLLTLWLDKLTQKTDRTKLVILSGHAKGADQLGERWCRENLIAYQVWRPEYRDEHDREAPLRRNSDMVASATHLVAFWDGASRGTADVVAKAHKAGLKVKVIRFG